LDARKVVDVAAAKEDVGVDPFAGTNVHSLVSVPEDDSVFERAAVDEEAEDVETMELLVLSPVTDELVADGADARLIGGAVLRYNVSPAVLSKAMPVRMGIGTLEAVVGAVRWMMIGLS
jgi:hypothetical protein